MNLATKVYKSVAWNYIFLEIIKIVCTYLRPVRSLPTMLITAILNTKLENMVNTPAIPAKTRIVNKCLEPTNVLLVISFTKKKYISVRKEQIANLT